MLTREQAIEILDKNLKNKNLLKHCLAVEAAMRALARKFKIEEEKWGLVGLLHDGDWEVTKDNHANHAKKIVEWLKKAGETNQEVLDAILSHNWQNDSFRQPNSPMEWSLFCSDELTGLIIATTLVMPDKKLASVSVESVLKKFPSKNFAAGVNREQIKMCEEKLGIELSEFIDIVLKSMQTINNELGL